MGETCSHVSREKGYGHCFAWKSRPDFWKTWMCGKGIDIIIQFHIHLPDFVSLKIALMFRKKHLCLICWFPLNFWFANKNRDLSNRGFPISYCRPLQKVSSVVYIISFLIFNKPKRWKRFSLIFHNKSIVFPICFLELQIISRDTSRQLRSQDGLS